MINSILKLISIGKRNIYKNPVISVTGTSGKTTTVKMIHDIIKSTYTVDKTLENSNSTAGIPYCITKYFNLSSDYWVIEIGIGNVGEMDTLLNIVKPNIRVITNIDEAHTDSFQNKESYQTEKLKYLENLPADTVLIINNDDPILSSLKFEPNIKVIKCGSKETDDIQIQNYIINSDNISSTFQIQIYNKIKITIKLNSIGVHNGINACLAIACAYYLNVTIPNIINSLDNFIFYQNRGSIIVKPSYTIYDYSYNCIPYACLKNLEAFKNINSNNKLVILGSEYGMKSSKDCLELLLNISVKITNNIIVYSKDLEQLTNSNQNIKIYNNFTSIINDVKQLINLNEYLYIFIQGSNKMELFNLIKLL